MKQLCESQDKSLTLHYTQIEKTKYHPVMYVNAQQNDCMCVSIHAHTHVYVYVHVIDTHIQ